MRPQDRKEDAYNWLPTVEQIAPGKVFGKGEGTIQKMHEQIGMSTKAGTNNMNRLKAEGRAHIHDWTRTQSPAPVWVKGPGKDMPKPLKTPKSELVRRQVQKRRERQQQEQQEAVVIGTSSERTARTIEQARRQPRQWWSWLDVPGSGEEQAA
jgi:hypothetical protein